MYFAGVVQAVAAAGGAALWAGGGSGFEEALRCCVVLLDDASSAVANAAAMTLGRLAASTASPAAQDAVRTCLGILAGPLHAGSDLTVVQMLGISDISWPRFCIDMICSSFSNDL